MNTSAARHSRQDPKSLPQGIAGKTQKSLPQGIAGKTQKSLPLILTGAAIETQEKRIAIQNLKGEYRKK